ncbi:hypothetical protein [Bacillus mycoides]|uniref:hypothetical protein n=1 Tax=Bacillus mycoides TaxID=1405 RepID=UPI003A7FED63
MTKKGNIKYWLDTFGYTWVGDKHPTHPIKQTYPYSQFTEEQAKVEVKSLEEDGYIEKLDK